MKNIKLLKINTLDNAIVPQEEKYPSGTIVAKGIMSKFTKPKVGDVFIVMYEFKIKDLKIIRPIFVTSIVKEIINKTKTKIIFKTLNSTYQINILK